jgi:hypothetical protein
VKEIPLTKGAVAIVDDEDYERLAVYSWRLDDTRASVSYALRGRCTRMHREVLGAPAGLQVDHINGNGLDNRKANLRLASRTENARNKGPVAGKRFKGVCEIEPGVFRARLGDGHRDVSLGCYRSEVDAARAYDRAAKEQWGEFARLNFPEESAA